MSERDASPQAGIQANSRCPQLSLPSSREAMIQAFYGRSPGFASSRRPSFPSRQGQWMPRAAARLHSGGTASNLYRTSLLSPAGRNTRAGTIKAAMKLLKVIPHCSRLRSKTQYPVCGSKPCDGSEPVSPISSASFDTWKTTRSPRPGHFRFCRSRLQERGVQSPGRARPAMKQRKTAMLPSMAVFSISG